MSVIYEALMGLSILDLTVVNIMVANVTTENVTTANVITENVTTSNIVNANITTANITTDNITTANIGTGIISGNLAMNGQTLVPFTPTVGDGGFNFTLSAATKCGYTRFGNYYYFDLHIVWTALNGAVGNFQITLPVTGSNTVVNGFSFSQGFSYGIISTVLVGGNPAPNPVTFLLQGANTNIFAWAVDYLTGATPTQLTCAANFNTVGAIYLSGWVKV